MQFKNIFLATGLTLLLSACGGGGGGGTTPTPAASKSSNEVSSAASSSSLANLSSLSSTAISSSANISSTQQSNLAATANAGEGTVIYPAINEGKSGESVSFRVAIEPGYEQLKINGCSGVLSGEIYTTGPLENNCTIITSATLTDATYPVTFNIPEGFTAEPSNTHLSIKAGETARISFTATETHRISRLQGNGGSWDGSTYISQPILKNTALSFDSEEVTADFKIWNTRVTPNALWHEDRAITPVCFEADVTGEFVSVIMSPKWDEKENRPMRVPMYDDGTHCDKTAGDGIYSGEFIFPDEYPYQLQYAGNAVGGAFMQFHGINSQDELLYNKSNALSEANGTHVFFIPKRYAIEPNVISENIKKTPHVFFIEQSGLTKDASYPDLAKTKIDLILGNNQFDFQINYQIGAQFSGVYPIQSYHRRRVDTYGIGLDGEVQTEEMAGRLLGNLYMSTGIGTVYSLSHEFMHAWTHFLFNPQLDLQHNAHNITCNSMGGIVGTSSIYKKNIDGNFVKTPPFRSSYAGPASELELYLAGLLPFENLPPEMYFYRKDAQKDCWSWGETPIPESEFIRVTPKNIIDAYGTRTLPGLREPRKEFQTLFVAVSDRVITAAEIAVLERVATYYESTDAQYSNEAFPPFYWMAREYGKMKTAIPKVTSAQ